MGECEWVLTAIEYRIRYNHFSVTYQCVRYV